MLKISVYLYIVGDIMFQVRELLEKVITEKKAFEIQIVNTQ